MVLSSKTVPLDQATVISFLPPFNSLSLPTLHVCTLNQHPSFSLFHHELLSSTILSQASSQQLTHSFLLHIALSIFHYLLCVLLDSSLYNNSTHVMHSHCPQPWQSSFPHEPWFSFSTASATRHNIFLLYASSFTFFTKCQRSWVVQVRCQEVG